MLEMVHINIIEKISMILGEEHLHIPQISETMLLPKYMMREHMGILFIFSHANIHRYADTMSVCPHKPQISNHRGKEWTAM